MANHLDPDRLMSIDEHGDRVGIIPAEVKGFWRRHRDWTQVILLLIFLILPWVHINGTQILLFDIPKRQFSIFGMTFWAHDAPLIFFILLAATIGLAYVTSIWGRVWCGWACPQTVFIDGVYRRIEKWVEGDYIKRRLMQQSPLTASIFFKKSVKWILFFLVSSIIAHSVTAYFVGSRTLIEMMLSGPGENSYYFVLISIVTLLLLFDFGWFREQFCIIMCPYGRIQSLLMDQNSLAVIYDEKRGEPRKGKTLPGEKAGDCVACNRCVQVCPTACDIRKGVQLECIACTACIDACDEIMEKVKKPKGLIRYDSVSGVKGQYFSGRSLLYLVIILVSVSALAYRVITRKELDISVIRSKDIPYTQTKDTNGEEKILNHFKLHIKNQNFSTLDVHLSLPESEVKKGIQLIVPQMEFKLEGGKDITLHAFIQSPKALTSTLGQESSIIVIQSLDEKNNQSETTEKKLMLLGPKSSGE